MGIRQSLSQEVLGLQKKEEGGKGGHQGGGCTLRDTKASEKEGGGAATERHRGRKSAGDGAPIANPAGFSPWENQRGSKALSTAGSPPP